MIQFNLLPDIKLEIVKAARLKHVVILVGGLASTIVIVIVILLFSFVRLQKNHIHSLSSLINDSSSQLTNTPNLNEILQLQNQVNSLPIIDAQKPVVSNLPGFISQLTPASVTISTLTVNFTGVETDAITLTGSADTLATVNTYVDTFKFATFQFKSSSSKQYAFTNVVLNSFGYTSTNGATYTITANFNPEIFNPLFDPPSPQLTIKTEITTRSELNQPTILFQPQPAQPNSSNG